MSESARLLHEVRGIFQDSALKLSNNVTLEMSDIDSMEDGILGSEAMPLITETRQSKSSQLRQAGIQRIHKDMTTVNQLFKDLSGIVVQQGEMIRGAEASVSQLVENSSKANE
jgi:hypothetical protein